MRRGRIRRNSRREKRVAVSGPELAKTGIAARLKPPNPMKHIITVLTLALGTLLLTPVESQARSRSSEGWVEYRKVRRVVGYTRFGHRPIYKWRTVRIYHKGYSHRRHRD
jgi:hypothetical protein